MTFERYMKDYRPEIKPATKEYYDLEMTWSTAKAEAHKVNMADYLGLVESAYQAKRDKLKKWVTHWMGKFMIVKAENNKLRNMNKALVKRNGELQDYMVKAEIGKYVENMGDKVVVLTTAVGASRPLEVQPIKHEKEPMKC